MVMIKIFNATDKEFNSAGNIIINPLYCHEIKKKSLNGWYIDVEVPIKYKEYIEKDKICVIKTKSKLKPQGFRISNKIECTTTKIKFIANHVMFDAEDYILVDARPTNLNGSNGLNYINQRTDKTSPFSFYSNVETINTSYFIRKNLLEAMQTFEEKWGGFFDADNWNISFLTKVGTDRGETIAYKKNMQGFKVVEDWSLVCTKLYPVGYDGIMLDEQYLESDIQYEKPYTRVISFETKLNQEEQTNEKLKEELKRNAATYLDENKIPKVSYTVESNVNQDLEIGDTIKVLHPFVNIFTEVLEYEYDIIAKRILKLTFGNYKKTAKEKFNSIKQTIEQINELISKQDVVIANQTALINTLNKNGYVYIDENEILILDALPKERAKNVWCFGLSGIGYSSTGYEGPFETAITIDGQINAKFITVGQMSIDRIEGLSNVISDYAKLFTDIQFNLNSINSTVKMIGGNNLQKNSIGAYGTADYDQSENGSIVATEEELLKSKTDNGFGRIMYLNSSKWIRLNSENLTIGETYTVSFKYSNTSDNQCTIKLQNNEEITLVDTTSENDLTKVVYTFTAFTENVKIFVSTADGTVGFTDYYLQNGDTATKWQPANGEVLSTVLSIYYNGIEVTSENSEIITKISNLGFSVVNKIGKVLITFNKDKCILSDTEVDGRLEQNGWLRYVQKIDNNEALLEVKI